MNNVKSEQTPEYVVPKIETSEPIGDMSSQNLLANIQKMKKASELPLVMKMIVELASREILYTTKAEGKAFTSPTIVSQFLCMHFNKEEREVFAVIFLDSQHRLIRCTNMFYGTIDGASVYPREVVKEALRINASAVIIAHNHPSGNTTPSQADKSLTSKLIAALGLIDVRILDHFVVGANKTFSFAENGMLM